MSAADAAARLRAHFGWAGAPPVGSVPALILLSGLPGTGKSYLAAAIQARHPAAVVRSDEVRKQLFPNPTYSSGENGFVYLTCYALVEQLLAAGYSVVFDATNLMRDGRKRVRKFADQLGVPSLTVLTVAPPEVVATRLRQRAAGAIETFSSDADQAVHEKLDATVEAMDAGREPYVRVDTSQDMTPALRRIDAFLDTARPTTAAAAADPGASAAATGPAQGESTP